MKENHASPSIYYFDRTRPLGLDLMTDEEQDFEHETMTRMEECENENISLQMEKEHRKEHMRSLRSQYPEWKHEFISKCEVLDHDKRRKLRAQLLGFDTFRMIFPQYIDPLTIENYFPCTRGLLSSAVFLSIRPNLFNEQQRYVL